MANNGWKWSLLLLNELRQKSANQISDKIDAEEWFTYFRKLSTPHNSAKSGFEKLVDFNVSKIAEFAKSNEPCNPRRTNHAWRDT